MNSTVTKILFTLLLITFSLSLFAHVELDNPKGGETFVSGTTVTIQWHVTITHVTLNWDLLISTDGGSSWSYIQENIPPGQTSFQWLVPGLNTSQTRISIIQDNEGQDYQDESNDFTIQSASSVEVLPESYMYLFPNPVSDVLAVDLSNNLYWPARLEMFDATGNSIWKKSDVSKITYLPVSSYPSGLYFLRIETAEGMTTKKFIIQRS